MPELKVYKATDLQKLTSTRPKETKLGELVKAGNYLQKSIRYVIFGIPEDIGVRANLGVGGTHTVWAAFLKAFLNIQSTQTLKGKHICVLGHLDCTDLISRHSPSSASRLRKGVESIDESVTAVIAQITSAGKMPIIIGGGHNNAYPIIKGSAKGYCTAGRIIEEKIHCINLDAHTDFRPKEGRHSGNGFRYAFTESYLDRYAIIGLHKNYNAQNIIDEIAREERIHYTFWEDIFLKNDLSFDQAVNRALHFTDSNICGIELDLDSIEQVLSSAGTPSGISTKQARRYLHCMADQADVAYLHVCEGATKLANGLKDQNTGKLIAYLVSDFLRSHLESN